MFQKLNFVVAITTVAIARKFGESYVIHQIKTIQSSSHSLADLFIRQTLKMIKYSPNIPELMQGACPCRFC